MGDPSPLARAGHGAARPPSDPLHAAPETLVAHHDNDICCHIGHHREEDRRGDDGGEEGDRAEKPNGKLEAGRGRASSPSRAGNLCDGRGRDKDQGETDVGGDVTRGGWLVFSVVILAGMRLTLREGAPEVAFWTFTVIY